MFDHKHYVPILKCKNGDMWSLLKLKSATADRLTPLIESVPPSDKKTEAGKVQETVTKIAQHWTGRNFFADLIWREAIPALPNGNHIATEFFNLARAKGLNAIPVTSPFRSQAFQAAIRGAVQQDGRGVAIRLPIAQFDDYQDVSPALAALVQLMGVNQNSADLIIDFGAIAVTGGVLAQLIRAALGSIQNIGGWRTLTVAAGSFPVNLQSLNQGAWNTLRRQEWTAWRAVVLGQVKPARLPTYSDYTVGDPGLPYAGFARYAVNLRYSANDNFCNSLAV